jgi:hypothetical protein
VFSVENLHHGLLVNTQEVAICHRSHSSHAERLTGEAPFPKEITVTQYAQGCFLAIVGHDRQLHLTLLNIKHCVSRAPLREDCLFLLKRDNCPALANRGKKCIGVKIAYFLSRNNRSHGRPQG